MFCEHEHDITITWTESKRGIRKKITKKISEHEHEITITWIESKRGIRKKISAYKHLLIKKLAIVTTL